MSTYDPKDAFVKDELAKDEVWMRDEIDSPCVKLCVIHPEERLCVGCYRTIEEISQWSRLAPAARAVIMADLADRAPRLIKRRGGRMGRLDRSGFSWEDFCITICWRAFRGLPASPVRLASVAADRR